jgi:hypothetical protein
MFETREKICQNVGVGAAAECGRAADWFAGARIADVLAEILLAADRAQFRGGFAAVVLGWPFGDRKIARAVIRRVFVGLAERASSDFPFVELLKGIQFLVFSRFVKHNPCQFISDFLVVVRAVQNPGGSAQATF